MSDEPFKLIKLWLGVLIFSIGLVALMISMWALFFWPASSFQRLGAVWIALTLLSIGLTKFAIGELSKAINGRGPLAERMAKDFAPVIYSEDKGWLNFMTPDGRELERPLRTLEEVKRELEGLEDYLSFRAFPTEFTIGIFATLQWGYGDLFHCFVHGKGWNVC
jgi:hypothetical protein